MIDNFLAFWMASSSSLGAAAVMALFAMAARATWAVGIPSLGSVSCGALAGYAATHVLLTGHSMPLALLVGGMIGFWFGLVQAFALVRLDVSWQALASLAMVAVIAPLARSLPGWAGGPDGLTLTKPPSAAWAIAVLAAALLWAGRAEDSWFDRAIQAIRHDPVVAAAQGIHVRALQSLAYGFAGLLGGLAGVLLVTTSGTATPGMFSASLALAAFAAMLFGGAYHWAGPLLGTALFALPTLALKLADVDASGLQDTTVAAVVILLLIFLPRGLLDPRESSRRAARARRRQRSAAPTSPLDPRALRKRRSRDESPQRSTLDAAIRRRTGGPK